ncbi:YhcN/YlaJ family sporulation lipoprotein [Desulfotomaculum sp. 1211_IL3151]|uniref:YhcN/YlaJ family sporulation lipoprotein n=1 Tax=Desulfotomaculum sp. 1211_IL3151 TaxID=3084055 RepID=UPI002FD9F435
MDKTKKILVLPATLLLGTALLFGGCTPAKKPIEPTQPAPTAPTNPTNPANPANPNNNQNQNYPREVADRVVDKANGVEGVRGSTAIIAGSNIYLGLDLNANLEKNRSAEVERRVLDQVKNAAPNYTVMVSSDVDTVTRIRNVAQGITQGRPISSFTNEIEDIGNRIQPKTK